MVNKVLSYIVIGAGVIVSLASFAKVRTMLKIAALPAGVSDNSIFIIGMVLLVIGAIMSFGSSGGKKKEVPIYHGEKIVGYRRTG